MWIIWLIGGVGRNLSVGDWSGPHGSKNGSVGCSWVGRGIKVLDHSADPFGRRGDPSVHCLNAVTLGISHLPLPTLSPQATQSARGVCCPFQIFVESGGVRQRVPDVHRIPHACAIPPPPQKKNAPDDLLTPLFHIPGRACGASIVCPRCVRGVRMVFMVCEWCVSGVQTPRRPPAPRC